MSEEGQLQNYSVDQAAGAIVLVLGAVASLLLVIWQSKCHCKMNLCWLFQCERRPPNEDEMKGLKEQAKKLAEKAKKDKDNKKPPLPPVDPDPMTSPPPDRTSSNESLVPREPEPEPEPVVSSWKKL